MRIRSTSEFSLVVYFLRVMANLSNRSGVFKTQTIGFRMTGPRSYLFYTCKTCKKSFKIGYLSVSL